jgi:large subunit ribosomal protein L3
MIGLLGKKLGMTQIFDKEGREIGVTVIEVGPCHVTGIRNKEKDGYQAVQLAFGEAKEKRLGKARMGHLKKAKAPALRFVREIRTEQLEGLQIGQTVGAANFEAGDYVDIQGTSIGKGFQGVVKRHHFKGALTMGHGDMSGRRPGSIGASSFPSRVVKGMRMGGHMGSDRVTTQNSKVMKVDAASNLLLVEGSVPGAEGAFVIVRTSLKRGTRRQWKVEGAEAAAKETKPAAEAAGKPESSEEKS